MKLSEAILLGSTVLAAKPGRQYFPGTEAGCALGMAAIANGCRFRRVTQAVAREEVRTLGAEGVWGKLVLRVVMRPCECSPLRLSREMRIKDIIAHIFDRHVVQKKNWTLDELVAWVQTWEPKEISSLPIQNTVPTSNKISLERAWTSDRPSKNGSELARLSRSDLNPSDQGRGLLGKMNLGDGHTRQNQGGPSPVDGSDVLQWRNVGATRRACRALRLIGSSQAAIREQSDSGNLHTPTGTHIMTS